MEIQTKYRIKDNSKFFQDFTWYEQESFGDLIFEFVRIVEHLNLYCLVADGYGKQESYGNGMIYINPIYLLNV